MCTPECFKWTARNISAEEVAGRRVLEIGAYDVNGSLRYVVEMLKPAEYIGTDILPGPGVDVVCPADELVSRFGKASFDVVISANVLEHIRDWRSAVTTMKQVLKPGGILLVMAPCVWVYHAHPGDYWRYSAEDFRAIFADFDALNLHEDPAAPSAAYGKFRKGSTDAGMDLAGIELYSIVTKSRVKDITDADFKKPVFLKTLLKYKLKMSGLAMARWLFRQV
jgi:SAM-dependent methyltransferase